MQSYRDTDPKWVSGVIVRKMDEVTFEVKLSNGILWKRHIQ